MLFASIVDDPSSRPEEFPTEEAQQAEQQRLFRIIEQLVQWKSSNDEAVLNRARTEILKAFDKNSRVVTKSLARFKYQPICILS